MRQYRIGDEIFAQNAPALDHALHDAYERKRRPLCLCREHGIAMYIARMDDQFLIKRMPLSGGDHHPSCISYEPPYELSGLGALMGSAIQLDPSSGLAALKLGFSLSRIGNRAAPVASRKDNETTKSNAKRLSLRGLLHYLWQEAELTTWTSRWAGKRHWWNVHWHLVEAAKQMFVKGASLSDILFVPEPFRSTHKVAIEQRRSAALMAALPPQRGPRQLMILVGEIKAFAPARTGQKLIVKHMPGFAFLVDDSLYRSIQVRFDNEIALWSADDRSHLMAIATFGLNAAGLAVGEEMALMVVGENWIPYESLQEKRLVDSLARQREQSKKGLRYDLAADQPTAVAMLPQHRPRPMAFYIVPAHAGECYNAKLEELIASRPEMDAWVWRVSEGEMPALPVP